jgi:hypothetical protein
MGTVGAVEPQHWIDSGGLPRTFAIGPALNYKLSKNMTVGFHPLKGRKISSTEGRYRSHTRREFRMLYPYRRKVIVSYHLNSARYPRDEEFVEYSHPLQSTAVGRTACHSHGRIAARL